MIGNGASGKALRFFTGGFATANERLRISATGLVGIGTLTPSTQLHVRTGVANDGGLRLENLTSSSAVTAAAVPIGVDATGKVVRTKSPTYYSGTGVASVNEITKVWVAEVANTSNGIVTVTIPANIGFTQIVSAQVTAQGGNAPSNYPFATIINTSLTSLQIRVLESRTIIMGSGDGLESHNDTSTKIFIRVEGY